MKFFKAWETNNLDLNKKDPFSLVAKLKQSI
jgi:hypothetical protein